MDEDDELPMPRWGRTVHGNGLVTQWIGPAPLVTVAAGLLPGVGWVLVSEHSPTSGGWQEMLLPLTPAQLLRPSKATVRALTFDLLLPTDESLALVPQWDQSHWGLRAWQLRKHPRANVGLDDERPSPVPRSTTPTGSYSASIFRQRTTAACSSPSTNRPWTPP